MSVLVMNKEKIIDMKNSRYFIEKQLEKLKGQEYENLKRQMQELDYSVLDELEKRETVNNRGKFAPLEAVEIDEIKARQDEFYKIGMDSIKQGKVGAVLLAGGQGTRLGMDVPKGCCNVGIKAELYIFECLFKNLMEVTNEANAYITMYIMTSESNHDDTVQFLEEHKYFGYPKEHIKFFIQEMLPAVDYEGRILMKSESEIATAPNGNGGWFSSMAKAGLLHDISKKGIEWINVFAVDNVLQKIADPLFIGATIAAGCQSGAKVVRKAAPDEKVGVLCLEDGKPSIAEYYEMTQEMATARKDNGDLKYGFGVILNYLFSEKKLEEIVNKHMPIHVVEKKIPYITEEGFIVKPQEANGYKFETLVLDMVHMMEDCLPYEVVREREFAPIKNLHGVDSLDSARELLGLNNIEL